MALADAILGQGTRLYYSSDNISYNELADLADVGEPDEGDVEQIESTPLNPSTSAKEFLNGLREAGTFTFDQYWTKARYTTLRTLIGTTKYWKIVFPESSYLYFQGNLKKARPMGFKRNEPIKIGCAVQITGGTTFTQS